jgi:hypothetical protein
MRELIAALCAAAYLTLVNSISVVLGLLKNARRCGRTAVHVSPRADDGALVHSVRHANMRVPLLRAIRPGKLPGRSMVRLCLRLRPTMTLQAADKAASLGNRLGAPPRASL